MPGPFPVQALSTVRAARQQGPVLGGSTGSVYPGGTGSPAPLQEGTGTFISCSFGSCRWHPSSKTWFSSTDMKTLEVKYTHSTHLISTALLQLAPVPLLPGADTDPHRAPHRAQTQGTIPLQWAYRHT